MIISGWDALLQKVEFEQGIRGTLHAYKIKPKAKKNPTS